MQIIPGSRSLQKPFQSSILTIGNYDGVHVGHQKIIQRLVAAARAKSLPSVVVTFDPHPVQVLYPDRKMRRIFSLEDQIENLQEMGVDYLLIEPFSREFSQLPPERFLTEWVFRPLAPELLIVGYDFSFGANRQGSIEFLRRQGVALGFQLEVIEPVKVGEMVASSSRIRDAIEKGDVETAKALLGRGFYLRGVVVKGAGRGRTLGIPTANLQTEAETIPARGVYAAFAVTSGGRYPAAVNIGLNPTFNETQVHPATIEAHILDFVAMDDKASDIYGERLQLEFVQRLRDEQKFSSVAQLQGQILRDIASCRQVLKAEGGA